MTSYAPSPPEPDLWAVGMLGFAVLDNPAAKLAFTVSVLLRRPTMVIHPSSSQLSSLYLTARRLLHTCTCRTPPLREPLRAVQPTPPASLSNEQYEAAKQESWQRYKAAARVARQFRGAANIIHRDAYDLPPEDIQSRIRPIQKYLATLKIEYKLRLEHRAAFDHSREFDDRVLVRICY